MGPRHFSILQRVFYTASGVGCGFLLESRDLVELESALSQGLHYGYQRITVTPSSLVTSFLGLQPQVPCWHFPLSGPIGVPLSSAWPGHCPPVSGASIPGADFPPASPSGSPSRLLSQAAPSPPGPSLAPLSPLPQASMALKFRWVSFPLLP